MRTTTIALAAALSATAAFAAATGRVVDPDGKPLAGIEVCDILHDVTTRCVKSDAQGYYRLEKPTSGNVFVRGSGFVPKEVAAVELSEPTVLKRASALLVRVVDAATGEPVVHGKVILNYTSGLQIGTDAPFNRAGVRISSLRPGAILARCEAEGYEPGGPVTITIAEGEQKEITLKMKRVPAAGR